MTPKERIEKHKASVKKHFLAKRLAKAKASKSNTAGTPKHKASPPSTAGKTISYFDGKSTVVDLGHKPSKSAISGAVAKLRKAKAATKPKATSAPPSAAKAPEIKLPNAPKPTTPNPATKKSATGDVWAGLAAAAGATGLAAGAVKLAMKKPSPKPIPTVKVKQVNLPAPNTGLPKPQLGLPGGKQSDRVAQVKEIQRKGKVLFDLQEKSAPGARRQAAKRPGSTTQASPELKATSAARKATQGTGLRHAFEAVDRADARASAKPAAKPTTKIINLGKNPSPIKIAEARAHGFKTPATQETSMAEPVQQARADAIISKASKGTQKNAAESLYAGDKRAADRRQGEATRRGPDRQTKRGAASETRPRDLGNQRSTRRKPGSDPRGAKPAAPKAPAAPAKPKAVSLTGEQRQDANKAARAAILSGDPVAAKKALAGLPETGRKAGRYRATLKAGAIGGGSGAAPKAPGVAKAPATPAKHKAISLTGAERQSANQGARAAMRSGDVVAMKKALATLPETGKKAIKYRSNLEAGIQSAGNKPAEVVNKAPVTTTVKTQGTRKQDFKDRQNRIDTKTGRPMPLDQDKTYPARTPKEIEAHQTRNLMETTIDEKRITPERSAAEARERANKMGREAQTELVVRAGREAVPTQGKAPTPTGREPASRGAGEAVAKAAVKVPEAPRVTVNEAAHEKMQRFNAEGRQTENVNVKEVAKQVQENAKLGQADNMRQKMARAAADAVLKDAGTPTSAAKPKAISLVSQSSTPAPKVSKAEAYRNYEALKQTGVKSPTAGAAKPKAQAPAKTDKATRAPLKPVGEQLPRSPAKGRVIPSRADMLAEQASGDTSPPKTPAKGHAKMNTPSSFTFRDSIRKYANTVVKGARGLTNPAIGAKVGDNITKPKSKVGTAIKGGAILTGLFAGLGGMEAHASETDPKKKGAAGRKAVIEGAKHSALEIAAYTGAAKILSAGVGGAVGGALMTTVLPAVIAAKTAKDFTIPMVKEATKQYGEMKYAKNAAASEKKGSEAKYGTIEKATRTRHAKEAIKKKQRDLLTGGK